MPQETAAVSAYSVYTIQPSTMSLHAKSNTSGACVFVGVVTYEHILCQYRLDFYTLPINVGFLYFANIGLILSVSNDKLQH